MGTIEILLGVAFPALLTIGLTLVTAGAAPTEFLVGRVCFVFAAIDMAGLSVWWPYVSENSSWKLAVGAMVGILLVIGVPQVLKWVDGREDDTLAQRKAQAVQDVGQIAPLIEVIRQQQSKLAGQEKAQKIIKRILSQYEQLNKGIEVIEGFTGKRDEQDRLAAAEHIIKELHAVLGSTVQLIETPDGRGLVIKTAPNTFRVTFPVPMRIAPAIVFPRLPAGSTANIIEKSNIGFTVVFTPPTIPIETIPAFSASAEL